MKLRILVWNGIFAALYVAVSFFIQPLAFGALQFRIPEMFNHLVVFNRRFAIGIVLGVFLTNLFFSELGAIDLVYGVGQSVLALSITMIAMRWIKGIWARMVFNTLIFSFTMFIIAHMLHLVYEFEWSFWITYLTTAISELIVMAIGAPIIYALNKRLNLEKQL